MAQWAMLSKQVFARFGVSAVVITYQVHLAEFGSYRFVGMRRWPGLWDRLMTRGRSRRPGFAAVVGLFRAWKAGPLS